jgi:hypothetical protein
MNYLIPERFDIVAKYLYAKYQDLGVQTDFHKQLYDEHIRVFNGGWEHPGTKNTVADFRYCFDELLKSLKVHGFDSTVSVVPIARNGIPWNGAHRIAACIWLGIEPQTRIVHDRDGPSYDSQFFATHRLHVPHGLKSEFSTVMALYYAILKSEQCRMVILFPNAMAEFDRNQFEEQLKEFGRLVYGRTLELNPVGLSNLLEECYYREPWVGADYAGIKAKFKECWAPKLQLQVYLFEPCDLGLIRMTKSRLRRHFRAGHHALHINDTAEETLRLAKATLHDNSIHWLNHSKPGPRHQWVENQNLVDRFAETLRCSVTPDQREHFLVDGSMVLSVYGLREANDLDYLHFGRPLPTGSSHNHEYPKEAIDDLIFNPKNYFYVHGVKFLALAPLLEFKQRRNEPKDILDAKLLEQVILSEE